MPVAGDQVFHVQEQITVRYCIEEGTHRVLGCVVKTKKMTLTEVLVFVHQLHHVPAHFEQKLNNLEGKVALHTIEKSSKPTSGTL